MVKLVPLTVRVFDENIGQIESKFLCMCLCYQGAAAVYIEKMRTIFPCHIVSVYLLIVLQLM